MDINKRDVDGDSQMDTLFITSLLTQLNYTFREERSARRGAVRRSQELIHTAETPERLNSLRSEMAKKEQAAVVQCAQQLRRVGDLLNWKYMLLEFIITLQKQETDGKR